MGLEEMYPAVLTIVIVGIALGVGLFVMSELRENIAVQQTGSDTDAAINGTTPGINQTTLSDSTSDDYLLISVDTVTIFNSSAKLTATTPGYYNFTTNGVITYGIGAVGTYGGGAYVNITSTYIYDRVNSPEEGINDSLEGLSELADWIAIIVVIIAAAIVLGIVMRSFSSRRVNV